MSTYWSEIPTDLLYSILSRLSVPDLFHCAAVCSHWSAVVDKLRRRPGDHRPQIPWLVPEGQFLMNGRYNPHNKYNFFSLSEGRVYNIPSPATRTLNTVVGSSYGWLITVGKVSVQLLSRFTGVYSVQLLNPITGVHINLPSISTMDVGWALKEFKGVLSSDPSRGGDYSVVFVFYSYSLRKYILCSVNAGDEKWKMIGDYYHYHDIAFHKGKLYVMSRSEENDEVTIAACDLITPDSTPTWTPVAVMSDATWDFDVVFYFLCPSSDDLLMARTSTKKSEGYIKLEVWNVDTEKGAIIAMNNLGNMEDESFAALSLRPFTFRRPILVWFAPSIAY
ncbi:F-box protein At5g25290-like [Curcuma longa]|uniref:F-box protein At5g25290-like n=1 Tax=Curcuma longa TaxID=136217 RepID=UPI003D9E7E55